MAKRKPKRGQMVSLDVQPLAIALAKALPHGADIRRVLRGLGSAARAEWVRLAQTELKTSARDYIAGIQEIEEDSAAHRVSIALVGSMPNMIETGWEGGDLRRTLLGPGARNAKTAKDGSRYNTIAFRHAAPGSSGRNTGKPMPRAVHNVAKALAPTLSRPGGGVSYGERLHPGMPMSGAAKKIINRKERPHHTASIYAGMIRSLKTYKNAAHSKYTTFRRISSKVKNGDQHWMHPGITARQLAKKVDSFIARVQADIVRTGTR